jgi:hypothetical protein
MRSDQQIDYHIKVFHWATERGSQRAIGWRRVLGPFGVGALHEFVGWFQGGVPLDHFPLANITIDAAAVSYGQVGIGHDVLRTAVSTEKVSAMDDCSSAHRGIVCTLAETLDRVLAGGSSSR